MTGFKMKAILVLLAVFVAVGLGGAYTYEYDALGRLTKATYPDGQTISYTYDKVGNLLSRAITAEPEEVSHDWNGDGIVSIVGDVPPFVNCVYFQNCPSGVDPIAVGDCSGDGIVSIVGDVPCFVDCVYFGNCDDD